MTALTLIMLTAFPAIIGTLVVSANTADTSSALSTITSTLDENATGIPCPDMGGMMLGDQRGGPRGDRGGFGAGFGNLELSSEYTQNVENIINNDTDVQALISQGYNMTSIVPIVHNVVGADGTITSKASTAIVTLENGTSGIATVKVDIDQSKVTQIVIVTRTVIDKTTS